MALVYPLRRIVVAIAVALVVAMLAMSSRGRQKRKPSRRAGDG